MASIHPSAKYRIFSHISDENTTISDILGRPIFDSNAELYCFLAALGLKKGKRTKTADRNSAWGQVRDTVFDNNGLMPRIYMIVLAHSKDYAILKDIESCFEIFEGYVNTGFEELIKLSKKANNEEEFVELVLQMIVEVSQNNVGLEDPLDDDSPLDLE